MGGERGPAAARGGGGRGAPPPSGGAGPAAIVTGTTCAGGRRERAAEKASTASAESTAAAIITRGREETWNVERKSASRVARPATCWAMSAPAATMAATTALRWLEDLVAGSIWGGPYP